MDAPKMDFKLDAINIVKEAEEKGITLRIMGATAFSIHCPKFAHVYKQLDRAISDIDFMASSKQINNIVDFLEKSGYKFTWGTWTQRKIYTHPVHKYTVDVFFDKLEMCHTIDFSKRLKIDSPTISLADLILEKLQIVQITEKDIKDLMILFLEHDVGSGDKETINSDYISDLLSNDWGFYYTATTNLKKLKELIPKYRTITGKNASAVNAQIDKLLEAIEKKPKSFGWKMRAKVGTKKKWYQDVEEK